MTAKNHSSAILAGALCAALGMACGSAARAADDSAPSVAAGVSIPAPLTVTLLRDGTEATFETAARTVGELLAARGLRAAPDDYVSPGLDQPLSEGARVFFRAAMPFEVELGKDVRLVRSAEMTVAGVLAEQHVAVRAGDEVSPALSAPPPADGVIRVVPVDTWTTEVAKPIAPAVVQRSDAKLAQGRTRTVDAGAAGLRVVTMRFVKRGDGAPVRTVLVSRIVRPPRAKIVLRGIATYDSLARIAERSFAGAVHFAGSALHMLATAYTAGCSGCSGITASGLRAGFGIIAVDPSVIPLGTHLYVPGYGRAVAGDTGGAINGRRIDLGFDSTVEAMRWGSRAVNVYVLR